VSQQPPFPVFCFEGQKVSYPASSFLPDIRQRWAWTGLDILHDTCDFFELGLDLDIHFWKKFGQEQVQDIVLISITKFSWELFKMSQMMVAVFSLLLFLYCQYVCVLHSSQSVVIRVSSSLSFSSQVEVESCSYVVGMLLCLLCWMSYVCAV